MTSNNKNYNQSPKKSLNFSQRVRHQRQISIDNFKLVRRLQSKKSYYDFHNKSSEKSSHSYRKNSQFIDFLSIDPSKIGYEPTKLSPLTLDVKILVLSKKILLNDRVFLVQIFKNSSKIKIHTTEASTNDVFSLELKKQEALNLMNGHENWEKLLQCLHIEGNDLTLWQDDVNLLNDL
jgi:hypothetical protein